ncbi:peroxisomal biogenesis factor 11-domain-containing protein [Powellomyces hirtus]|nr:peroxisomal biogenesis factor 11-domain-containing protein [Powellomyces hirtus]
MTTTNPSSPLPTGFPSSQTAPRRPSLRALSRSSDTINTLGAATSSSRTNSGTLYHPTTNPSLFLGIRSGSYAGSSSSNNSLHRAAGAAGSYYSAQSTPSASRLGSPRGSIVERMTAKSGESRDGAVSTAVAAASPVVHADLVRRLNGKTTLQKDASLASPTPSTTSTATPSPPTTSFKQPSLTRTPTPFARLAPTLLTKILILRRVLLLTDGRDKIMKCLQYVLKSAMWAQLITSATHPRLHAHAASTVSHFSTARKIMRLLYWLNSLNDLVDLVNNPASQPPKAAAASPTDVLRYRLALVNAGVGIVNGWADDLVVAGKLGIIDKPLYNRATVVADQLWLVSIFIDLHENIQAGFALRRKLAAACNAASTPSDTAADTAAAAAAAAKTHRDLTARHRTHTLSLIKLLADLTFCSIDVFRLAERRGISDGWQAISGLASALLGTYKVWVKHR